MKKHIKKLNPVFILLALSLPFTGMAKGPGEDVQRKKTINKSYNVTADDKLEIENSFGNVMVSTWDKNEITVDIEIVANAPTDQKAQDIMDEIDVKDIHEGHIISFKTKVGDIHNGNDKKRNKNGEDEDRAFYIDYIIHMPAANRLDLENSFGKTVIPDFNGQVSLTSKFGSLTTGKLTNVDNIDVEFGKALIKEIANGKVVFKFNKESTIGKVDGSVKISSEFSQRVSFNVANDIKELSVFESYSGVRMIVTKALSAEIDVHTSFGSFHNDSEFSIKEQKEGSDNDYGPHFDKDYAGKAGDGRATIKIKSSFGNVRLSHTAAGVNDNDEDDEKGKDKDKDKHKDKHKDKDKDKDDDDNSSARL
ncbi:MAG TPA: hypothetical protein VK563_17125 [Puia sp.]|nr:hypothetical protein [Puia sp.]